MKTNRSDVLATVAIGLAFAASLACYGQLPDPVPTHWSLHGHADGFTLKPMGPFVLPLAMLALGWLLRVLSELPPGGVVMGPLFPYLDLNGTVQWSLLAIHGALLLRTLGVGVPLLPVLLLALLALLAHLGVAYLRLRRRTA